MTEPRNIFEANKLEKTLTLNGEVVRLDASLQKIELSDIKYSTDKALELTYKSPSEEFLMNESEKLYDVFNKAGYETYAYPGIEEGHPQIAIVGNYDNISYS